MTFAPLAFAQRSLLSVGSLWAVPFTVGLLAVGLLTPLAACSDPSKACESDERPPMTQERASAVDPSVHTGLAVSTTLALGDCRPNPDAGANEILCTGPGSRCQLLRTRMEVFIVPSGESVPSHAECEGGPLVEELRRSRAQVVSSSEDGELVVTLQPGVYSLFLSAEDSACAACSNPAHSDDCEVEVRDGMLVVRDLFCDRASY